MDRVKTWLPLSLLVLVIVGLLSLQTFLRQQAASATRSRLVIWHSYIGAEAEALHALVAKFNAEEANKYGYRLETLFVSFSNLPDKLTNSLPRGQGPDLFIFGHDRLEDWMAKGLLAPVDYYLSPMELEDFSPKMALDTLIRAKRLYALPLSIKTLALYYRKLPNGEDVGAKIKALQKAGKWNMEEFTKLATSLTRPCPWSSTRCYGLGYQPEDAFLHSPWLHAFGGEIITPEGVPSIVTEAGIQAAKLAYNLAGNHSGAVVPQELSFDLMSTMFKNGEIALVLSGPWFMSTFDPKSIEFGITTLPTINGKPAAPYLTIEALYMSAKTKDKGVAAAAMKFLAGAASAELRARLAGQLPVRDSTNQKLLARCQGKRATTCLYHKNFFGVFTEAAKTAVVMPSSKEARIVWPPYNKALAAIVKRGVSPKRALEEAEWEINKYLGACLRRGK